MSTVINIRDDENKIILQLICKPVVIEGITLALHQGLGSSPDTSAPPPLIKGEWQVSEPITGRRVARNAGSPNDAIDKAASMIRKYGVDKVKAMIGGDPAPAVDDPVVAPVQEESRETRPAVRPVVTVTKIAPGEKRPVVRLKE